MSKPVKTLVKYLAAVAACLVLGGLYLLEYDFLAQDLQNRYRLLSDAFALPGFLCLFVGLFLWLSNEGSFDGVSWVLSYAVKSLLPVTRMNRESYSDYRSRKQSKKVHGYGFLLVVGVVMLALSGIFVYLFNSMY